jgi:hypothetical protein
VPARCGWLTVAAAAGSRERESCCASAHRECGLMFDALRSSNSCRSLGRVGTQPTVLPSRVVGARFPFGTVRIAASVSACSLDRLCARHGVHSGGLGRRTLTVHVYSVDTGRRRPLTLLTPERRVLRKATAMRSAFAPCLQMNQNIFPQLRLGLVRVSP